MTPAGPATVRGNWLGAFTAEGRPPEILVGWTVTVGPGSSAGPVRLRVLRRGDGAPIAPGDEADVRIWSYSSNGREPTRVEVAAEGPDLTPEDNAGQIRPAQAPATTPRLSLRTPPGRKLRVRLTASRPGIAVLVARVAGLRIRRTLRFAVAGTRTAQLMPTARRDRRRLAAAQRRPGRLRATVTATMADVRVMAHTTLP